MSSLPPSPGIVSPWKAILVPSGDHVGPITLMGMWVTWTMFVPAAFAVYIW
jgi:hypothetical protein